MAEAAPEAAGADAAADAAAEAGALAAVDGVELDDEEEQALRAPARATVHAIAATYFMGGVFMTEG